MPGPGRVDSGWLNRAVAALPAGERVASARALAVGATAPLVIRGPAPILGWAPSGLAAPTDDLLARLMDLYDHSDPALAKALQAGLDADRLANRQGMDALKPGGDVALLMRKAAEGAARLMAADDGPRVGALAFDGWDTHANEGGATGRLAQLLGGLDGAFAAFESELGPRWNDTVVVAITEFGRTARINGTVGTDHGTATVAFLAGGALSGRARRRRLAGAQGRRPLRAARPQADCRPARGAQRRARRTSRPVGRRARARRVPRYARRRADEGTDRRVTRRYLPCRTI